MPIYLTEYFASNEIGRVCKWCGPKIEAVDLKEAEKKAEGLKVTVVGEWKGDIEWEGADDFCERIQKEADEVWLKNQK